MTTPIQLVPTIANTQLAAEQVAALVTVFASVTPPLFALPKDKTLTDLKGLSITILPNGKGFLNARF